MTFPSEILSTTKKQTEKNTNHFHSGNSSQHGSCPFQTQPYHSSWREHIYEEFRHLISSWESMKSTKKNSIYRFHIKIIQIHNLSIGGTSDSQEVSRDRKRARSTILIGTDRNGMNRQKDLFLNDDDESR